MSQADTRISLLTDTAKAHVTFVLTEFVDKARVDAKVVGFLRGSGER